MTQLVSEPETRLRYRWVIFAVLWVSYVVAFLNRLSVGPLGAFFKPDLGLSSAQLGLVLSAGSFGYLVSQVPVGWVADRVGARWPIALGEFVAAGSMISLWLAPSYGTLLVLMFITGVGCGFLAPSTTQAVIVWFAPSERATVMGLKQTAINIGGIVGAAVLPLIAVSFGWRTGFLALGIIAAAAGILTLTLYRNPPEHLHRTDQPAKPPSIGLLDVLADRQIWLVSMAAFLLNWIELAMIGHFVLYLTRALAIAPVVAGGLLALAESAGAVTRPVSGLVSDRVFGGRRNPLMLIFASTATAMCVVLALAGPHLGWLLYPTVFALGIGAVGFGGIYLTLLAELGGAGGAAKAAGVGSTIAMGGSILGPPAFGYIVDVTGSYQLAWLSLAAVGIACLLVLLFVDESKRRI